MLRATAFAAALLCASPAYSMPCWIIRKAVEKYGEHAVESFARSKGATDRQISEHKKCLVR